MQTNISTNTGAWFCTPLHRVPKILPAVAEEVAEEVLACRGLRKQIQISPRYPFAKMVPLCLTRLIFAYRLV